MKSHEKFKDISAGIQSLIVSLAIIIGGVWTVYRFAAIDRSNSLDLSIEAEYRYVETDNKPSLIVKIIANNNGGTYLHLNVSNAPLVIQKLALNNKGEYVATRTYKPTYRSAYDVNDKSLSWTSQSVQPKSKKVLPFFQHLDESGIYFIKFMAPDDISDNILRRFVNFILGIDRGTHWVTSTYTEVKPRSTVVQRKGAAVKPQNREAN